MIKNKKGKEYIGKWVTFLGNPLALFYIKNQYKNYVEYTDNSGTFWERTEYIEHCYSTVFCYL